MPAVFVFPFVLSTTLLCIYLAELTIGENEGVMPRLNVMIKVLAGVALLCLVTRPCVVHHIVIPSVVKYPGGQSFQGERSFDGERCAYRGPG